MSVLGNDTVTFIAITDGVKDRLGIPAVVRTPVAVTGCRFRPLSVEETIALTDKAIEMWKCTAPPNSTVLAAKSIDEVQHNGITYQLEGGIKPYPTRAGNIRKITVMCKKENA